MSRLSGSSFDVEIMGTFIHVETATVSIDDGTQVAKERGIPNGHIDGEVGADVEYELSTKNFNLLIDAARKSGSWRGMKPHDALFYANNGDEEMKVELDAVKLLLSDVLNVDSKGGELTKHKVKGFVTGSDFVKINGVPYLSDYDIRNF